jgi:hypothetical protein
MACVLFQEGEEGVNRLGKGRVEVKIGGKQRKPSRLHRFTEGCTGCRRILV